VLGDARVAARNTETGFVQTVTSDSTGSFLFSRLPVGSYELRVEKPGFSAYVRKPYDPRALVALLSGLIASSTDSIV